MKEEFPHVLKLRHGAILNTIAHGIWIMIHPSFVYERYWQGMNYHVQDGEGCRGIVRFLDKNDVIGMFFDEASPRNPSRTNNPDIGMYFHTMPSSFQQTAEQKILPYLVDDYKGNRQSIITASFWNHRDRLTSFEEWPDVVSNGAHILHREYMENEEAIFSCQEDYEFTNRQTELLTKLFNQRVQQESVFLDNSDMDILMEAGSVGLEDVQNLYKSINIFFPNI